MRRLFHRPGWLGVRLGAYVVVRDVRRHPLRFSERHRKGCARLAHVGPWELWVKP